MKPMLEHKQATLLVDKSTCRQNPSQEGIHVVERTAGIIPITQNFMHRNRFDLTPGGWPLAATAVSLAVRFFCFFFSTSDLLALRSV